MPYLTNFKKSEMGFEEIKGLIISMFGSDIILKEDKVSPQPSITIPNERLLEVCQFLHVQPQLYFDFLACITGIDNGPEVGTMEVIYHFTSIPYEHNFVLKVEISRNKEGEPLPKVYSLTPIWRTADWHEREAYDLLGIDFIGHPDLRRILMPADWQGYPLRKDYEEQTEYHGIIVKY
ncbi:MULTISPECIES: NADH-quinone oxidoreductase subunit C [Emticicia]|uniref:NADH-quinone oxidoreductase subunit C n=1 Tax=Emticicia TaxID=312278 RepID=UPI000B10D956|nr:MULTISPECIES: NADH-quinone oxidoreductase subunit C [Emticicia]